MKPLEWFSRNSTTGQVEREHEKFDTFSYAVENSSGGSICPKTIKFNMKLF